MATFEVINRIARYGTTFLGADSIGSPDFLGWIELIRPNGDPAGYIYLENGTSGSHLGGVGSFDPPYVVMSRPIDQAHLLFTVLDSGRALQIRYFGETEDDGSAFLESDFTTLADDARREIEARAGRQLFGS